MKDLTKDELIKVLNEMHAMSYAFIKTFQDNTRGVLKQSKLKLAYFQIRELIEGKPKGERRDFIIVSEWRPK